LKPVFELLITETDENWKSGLMILAIRCFFLKNQGDEHSALTEASTHNHARTTRTRHHPLFQRDVR
jgi:hypothetical protein